LALISEEEEALGRSIRHAVVFTMTRAIKSKQHTAIELSLTAQGVDVIIPPLMERAAFLHYSNSAGISAPCQLKARCNPLPKMRRSLRAVFERLARTGNERQANVQY
jgi:chromosome partitioning protein